MWHIMREFQYISELQYEGASIFFLLESPKEIWWTEHLFFGLEKEARYWPITTVLVMGIVAVDGSAT